MFQSKCNIKYYLFSTKKIIMSSSSSTKKIQATVAGHKGKLVVSKVPAIEMERNELMSTPSQLCLLPNVPSSSSNPNASTLEFIWIHIDRESLQGQNFSEIFTKRATIKDTGKMSVAALAEYNRLRRLSLIGTKLLTKLCDFPGLSSVMRVSKAHLNTLEVFTSKAPNLISCLVEVLRSLAVADISDHLLFRRFSSAFALKRRVTMRLYKKTHPNEVLIDNLILQ